MTAARRARLRLGQAISGAFSWERMHPDLTSDAKAKQRAKSIHSMLKQIDALLQVVEHDPVLRGSLRAQLNTEAGTGLHEVTEGLRRLKDAACSLKGEWLHGTAPLSGLDMTAQELLFDGLAKAYREGMDADPAQGTVKTYNAPRGAFVAFIRAAFTLAGKPQPTDPALYKALQRTGTIGPTDIA